MVRELHLHLLACRQRNHGEWILQPPCCIHHPVESSHDVSVGSLSSTSESRLDYDPFHQPLKPSVPEPPFAVATSAILSTFEDGFCFTTV